MSPRSFALAAALALSPLPLLADITPDALWRDWQDRTGATAAEIDGDGGDLTLSGIRLPLGAGAPVLLLDTLTLTATDDGRVEIAVPVPARVSGGGLPAEVEMTLDLTQAEAIAERPGDDISYDVTAETATLALDPAGTELPAIDYAVSGLAARVATGAGDTLIETEARAVEADAILPGGRGTLVLALADTSGRSVIARDDDADPSLPQVTTRSSFGPMLLRYEGGPGARPVTVEMAAEGGAASTDLRDGAQSVTLEAEAIDLAAAAAMLPGGEADGTLSSLRYALTLPSQVGGPARPLALELELADIAPSQALWDRLDPDGALPRDPGRILLQMTGEGRLPEPDAMADGAPPPPDTLATLALNALEIAGLGAVIAGSGQVDTPLAPEAASGTLEFTATGLLDAITALAAAGLLPPGPELGARMGLAYATVPDPGTDGLRADITFGPDGAITLNDRPLR